MSFALMFFLLYTITAPIFLIWRGNRRYEKLVAQVTKIFERNLSPEDAQYESEKIASRKSGIVDLLDFGIMKSVDLKRASLIEKFLAWYIVCEKRLEKPQVEISQADAAHTLRCIETCWSSYKELLQFDFENERLTHNEMMQKQSRLKKELIQEFSIPPNQT